MKSLMCGASNERLEQAVRALSVDRNTGTLPTAIGTRQILCAHVCNSVRKISCRGLHSSILTQKLPLLLLCSTLGVLSPQHFEGTKLLEFPIPMKVQPLQRSGSNQLARRPNRVCLEKAKSF